MEPRLGKTKVGRRSKGQFAEISRQARNQGLPTWDRTCGQRPSSFGWHQVPAMAPGPRRSRRWPRAPRPALPAARLFSEQKKEGERLPGLRRGPEICPKRMGEALATSGLLMGSAIWVFEGNSGRRPLWEPKLRHTHGIS